MARKIPTLLDLCVQTAIDNLRYMGDVGEMDVYLLKDILPHCTVDQLAFIEKSTRSRDLSPVTNDLWKRFYEQRYGIESMNLAIKKMKDKRVVFKWRQLFEAKIREREEDEQRVIKLLNKSYAKEESKKLNRQIQICSKAPPSRKRSFFEGFGSRYNVSHLKSNIMKKAKIETLKSHEAKIHAVMKRKSVQASSGIPKSVHLPPAKPSRFQGKGSTSKTKPAAKPSARC